MIKAIVTDIEGTTSSLSFVKDILFPFAREHMADFIKAHADVAEVRACLDKAREVAGGGFDDAQVTEQLVRWIDEDRKVTPLKTLQGMLWEDGYRTGELRGHVYEDAVHALKEWKDDGLLLYVFSSGSVQAQKLLFAHTEYGDLTPLFTGYFDTNIGSKREAQAYQAIAKAIGVDAGAILFLSDVREELDAAREAGMHTVWLRRDGNLETDDPHLKVRDFGAIDLRG